MIKALVFDMDGLLLDSERIVQRTWKEMGEVLGIPGMGDHIYNTLGMNRKARAEYFFENISTDFPLEQFQDGTRRLFYEIVEKEGLPVKCGVRELLEYGKRRHLKMAVATSSSGDYARKVLEDAKIWKYFDAAVFGDMVTRAKPDPQIYLTACEKISVAPEDAMAFEDAPSGIRSAHAAGLTTVMIPDLLQPSEDLLQICDYCFGSLKDVPERLFSEEL